MRLVCLLLVGMGYLVGCSENTETREESSSLGILEYAISDAGYWSWWTQASDGNFHVEFGGVLLYNEPAESTTPPPNALALRFTGTRYVAALRRETGLPAVPDNWLELLADDKLKQPTISHDRFTLSSLQELEQIVTEAKSSQVLLGELSDLKNIKPMDAFLAFWAGDVGLVIVAREMVPVAHSGVLSSEQIIEKSGQWWDYWGEYWRRKDTPNPMPLDYACEVTIPAETFSGGNRSLGADVGGYESGNGAKIEIDMRPMSNATTEEISKYIQEAREQLAVEQDASPEQEVAMISEWVKEYRNLDHRENDELELGAAIRLGCMWGDAVSRKYGWEWMEQWKGEGRYPAVVEPNLQYVIYPIPVALEWLSEAKRNPNVELLFEYISKLPPAENGALVHLE